MKIKFSISFFSGGKAVVLKDIETNDGGIAEVSIPEEHDAVNGFITVYQDGVVRMPASMSISSGIVVLDLNDVPVI